MAAGELTHELTFRAIVYEELPPVIAKGKAEPVVAWRAVAPIARTGAAAGRRSLTPLVGRAKETSELRALLDGVITNRMPSSVLLVGEPGIGKTRLVQELFADVDSRPDMITWRQAHCPSFDEGTSYWALAQIVKAHAGILDTDDAATMAEKLTAVVPDAADHAWLVNRLRALVGLEAPRAEREESFTAWLRFFERLARDEPLVLVFEDLHWADEGLLAFIEHLAGNVEGVPLFLVGTSRMELLEAKPAFGASGAGVRRLPLGPLSPGETEQLVAGVLGERESRGQSVADVATRCAGNPFFAEESARLLGDQEHGSPVPASVQAVIAARLDALPASDKTAVGDAAVIGEVFWDGALAELGRRERDDVGAALDALEERRFVRRARDSSLAGEHEFAFAHALARDVAYGAIPRRARAVKHAQAAGWLEARSSRRLEDVAEMLTHHLTTAIDLARAVGDAELAERCREPAVTALRLAGERAMRLDVEAAESLFARAAGICLDDDPQRADLFAVWGRSLLLRDRHEDAKVALEESARCFLAKGRKAEAAIVMTELETALFFLGGRSWRTVLDEALELTADQPDCEARALVMTAVARGQIAMGDYTDGLAWVERAVGIYGRCGMKVPLNLQSWQAQAAGGLGDRSAGDRLLSVARAMLDEGVGRDVAVAYLNYGVLMYPFEGPRAYDIALEGLDFLRTRGIPVGQGLAVVNRCTGLISAGRWDEAQRSMEESRAWLQQADDQLAFSFWWVNLAELLALVGRGPEALASAREATERGRQWDDPVFTIQSRATLILASALVGDEMRAIELLGEFVQVPRRSGFQGYEEVIPQLMRFALGCGETDLAQRLIVGIEPDVPLLEHVLTTGRALLAEAHVDRENAATSFTDAVNRWHEFGVPYEEAQALLGLGRCLMALGRAPEASAPLAAAHEIFARLGAKPALAETEEWLARAKST